MSDTQLIAGAAGKIEVEALWQSEDNLAKLANSDGSPHCKGDTVALLCHPNPLYQGTMNNKVVTTMYRFARDEGMHAVRFNFRGVGRSTGEHDYGVGEVEDAMAVLQWIATQTPARKLWLGGFSFGGYVIARVAQNMVQTPHIWGLNEFEVSKVALIAPSVENNDVSDLSLPANKTFEIYGDADKVIDPDSMQAFADRLQIPTSVVSGAGHFFHGRLTELKDLLYQHTFNQD